VADGTTDALLVIADIGGYTRFMTLHRTSLAHAQENTSRLLDAIIDAAPDLELSGLEGDAAFLYATEPSADEITRSLAGLASAMHRAFHDEQQRLEVLRICWCDGCKQTGKLTVKVVAH
jgi:D-serine deaminase-like pyridoxal phosphate-dependent protein